MSGDFSELDALAADLSAAPTIALDRVRAVVGKGALNIKQDWRDSVTGINHLPQLPQAVNYDLTTSRAAVEAEIGYDKDKPQGPLGNLREFGSVNNPPHADGQKALDREEPRFVAALEDAIGDVL